MSKQSATHRVSSPQRRTASARRLTLLSHILTSLFLLLSFAFILKTLYSPDFVTANRTLSSQDDTRATGANAFKHKSPWHTCISSVSDSPGLLGVMECTRTSKLGKQLHAQCLEERASPLADHVCQQIVMSAELGVTAAVFIGLSFGLSLVLLFLAWARHNKNRDVEVEDGLDDEATFRRLIRSWLLLQIVIGTACMFLCQLIGANALVNLSYPNGDWAISAVRPGGVEQAAWYLGVAGRRWASLGWAMGGLAGFVWGQM